MVVICISGMKVHEFNFQVPKAIYILNIHAGKSETKGDKLRSILAQLEYVYQIDYWESQGVPFRSHVHVPECHPITGTLFCEREDEGHVFKVHDL